LQLLLLPLPLPLPLPQQLLLQSRRRFSWQQKLGQYLRP